jgi:hypothetical protein
MRCAIVNVHAGHVKTQTVSLKVTTFSASLIVLSNASLHHTTIGGKAHSQSAGHAEIGAQGCIGTGIAVQPFYVPCRRPEYEISCTHRTGCSIKSKCGTVHRSSRQLTWTNRTYRRHFHPISQHSRTPQSAGLSQSFDVGYTVVPTYKAPAVYAHAHQPHPMRSKANI